MSGLRSRRKGIAYERELVRMLREAVPGATVRRGIQMRSGQEVPDVELPGFWLEAKRGKKPNPRRALAQAIANAPKGRWPLAVIRDDGNTEAMACLRLSDFLDFLSEWWDRR